MTDITIADVMTLHQMTGVGIMECKKALIKTKGDCDAAVKLLRGFGGIVATKRKTRLNNQLCIQSANAANSEQTSPKPVLLKPVSVTPISDEIVLADGVPASPETDALLDLFRQTYRWIKQGPYPSIGRPGRLYRNPDGGWQCNCENWAAITLRPGSEEPFEVHGAICARWYAEGGAYNERGTPGKLGYPISDEKPYTSMGRRSDRVSYFERGDITWNSEKNVCYVSLKNGDGQMAWTPTAFRLKPAAIKEVPFIVEEIITVKDVPFDSGMQTNSIRYLCPKCGACVEVQEDSDDYLVNCPGCSSQLDLTELEPES